MTNSMTVEQSAIVPPPWRLQGDGIVLLYRFTPAQLAELGVPTPETGEFRGGIGALMLVDYSQSGVGPYRELLFCPGRFRREGRRGWSLSHCLVSTEASVVSGRANWGIPKTLADFRRTHEGDVQGWSVSSGGHEILSLRYRPGHVAFRAFTGPFSVPLIQHLDGRTLVTGIRGGGICKLTTRHHLRIDPAYFPDVSGLEPLGVVRVTTFRMTFPAPKRAG